MLPFLFCTNKLYKIWYNTLLEKLYCTIKLKIEVFGRNKIAIINNETKFGKSNKTVDKALWNIF